MTATIGSTRGRLERQAQLYAEIRKFFAQRGVIEVTSPALSPAGISDIAIDSLNLQVTSLGKQTQYLHTSPEYAMKRLLAADSGDIYQLCRVFRDGELGRWHQPEFMLLEWYRIGFDESALMDEVFELLALLLADRLPELPQQRRSYGEIFMDKLGLDPHRRDAQTQASLKDRLASAGIDSPQDLNQTELLDLTLSELIVPTFPTDTACFIYDYPANQAALAQIKRFDPPVAARFEVFMNGIELGNGFRELTDAKEQRRRFEAELAKRTASGRPTPPLDEAFLAALETGLPACAGVAIGVDRLIAVEAGADKLSDVINFPHELET